MIELNESLSLLVQALLNMAAAFVVAATPVIAGAIGYALKVWWEARKQEKYGNVLVTIEDLAQTVVKFVEVAKLQGVLEMYGRDKKDAALNLLEERLKQYNIKADVDVLDQAIEAAWFDIFKDTGS